MNEERSRLRAQFRIRRFAGTATHAEALDGLRVVHLTDLHVGRVTPHRAQLMATRLCNEERPDLVVITGDFVCHSQAHLDELRQVIASIDAPVVTVLGNHDYWSGAKGVVRALKQGGAEVLQNQNTTLRLRGQRLQIVGLDDAYTGHHDRAAAVKGLNPKIPSLGLSHIAEEADALWQHGVPLVLSGHTHAGQITVARLHELSVGRLAGHRYIHGLYGKRRAAPVEGAVYVGAGIGAAVIPLRVGELGKREVTVFELGAEPGSMHEPLPIQKPHPGRRPSLRTKRRRERAVAKKKARRERRAG